MTIRTLTSSRDIAGWIEAARGGSREALGRLFELCIEDLKNAAHDCLGVDVVPKLGESDLIQEALLDAHKDFHQFEGATKEELLAWLRKILWHTVANEVNRFRNTMKRDVAREVSIDDSRTRLRNRLVIDTPLPFQKLQAEEEGEFLLDAFHRLSERDQEIIHLRHFQGYSFPEIGKLLGLKDDAARLRWTRALERFRLEFERGRPGSAP